MTSIAAARLGAGLFFLTAALPLYASEADGPTIIVTARDATTDQDTNLKQTPGGVDSVAAADYADKSIVSLRDALAFSPGVYLQPRYGQEVRLSIRGSGISRGFHMRGITLLQDGVPINLADDNGDFQELDPTFFDRLDVYRGGNALRFGASTLGGAINGITPTGRTAPGVYTRLDGGSFDTLRGLISAGMKRGAGDAWGAVQIERSDGDRRHATRRTARFQGNVGLKLAEGIETRLYASLNNINQEIPGALDLATVLTRPRTGNSAGDQARDIDSIRLQNRTRVEMENAVIELGGFLNLKQLYHPIFQVVDQESSDKGGFARFEGGWGPFGVTLGFNARYGTVRSKRFINVNGKRGARTFDADQRAHTTDLYGEGRFKPLPQLTLIAGAVRTEGERRQQQRFPTIAVGKADFDQFSPKIGVLYEPRDGVQVYANYNRSTELPGFIELAQVASFVPVSAQRAWTLEVGTRGEAGAIGWDVSAYRSDLRREILQFNVGPDIPASTFNAGKTRHQGVEAALTVTPLPYLRLRQLWTYSDFRFRDDSQFGDNRLPVIPTHFLRTDLRLGTDRANLTPAVEWVPKGAWADYRNTLRVKGYALLNVTAGARLTAGIDLFLDARNLTGKKAVGDISAVIAATPASVIFNPVERRALYGGVRARF